ncbi:glycosyltransferase family 2 protein [Nocardia brasiliensis]|uniref:glycosyltransferase family 2 protein n=1 Tax=Nocardia brasiliensis TaxID=37326 RepID=UPI002457D9B1|nr:glycosyltransferase [Nocardia brasiliensis]
MDRIPDFTDVAVQQVSSPLGLNSLRSELFRHNNDYGADPRSQTLRTPPLSVSCVIPYHETGPLAWDCVVRLARALRRYQGVHAENPQVQIVVVDDGSVRKPFPHQRIHELKVIRWPVNRGRSAARNTGLQASAGFDMTVFLDSDILVPEDLIIRMVELWDGGNRELRVRPAVVASLLSTLRTAPDTDLDRVLRDASVRTDWRWSCRYQPQWVFTPGDWMYVGRRFDLVEDTNFFRSWSGMVGPWSLPNMVLGGCFAVPTAQALSVGGFDESFAQYGFTETSLVARLIGRAIPVVPQVKSAAVHVEHNPDHHTQSERVALLSTAHRKFFTEFLTDDHI